MEMHKQKRIGEIEIRYIHSNVWSIYHYPVLGIVASSAVASSFMAPNSLYQNHPKCMKKNKNEKRRQCKTMQDKSLNKYNK